MRHLMRVCLLVAILPACRGSSAPSPDRPLSSARVSGAGATLVLEDSVSLTETDSSTIGQSNALAIGSGGEIFVADDYSARVLEFTRTGQFVRAYGHKGNGPGELGRPLQLMLLGDSLLVVSHVRPDSPVVFDRRTGAWITTGRVSGYIQAGQQVGDSLWFGVMSTKRVASLASWTPGADSMHYFGPIPDEYAASARLWSIMPAALFTVWSDTVTVGFAGVNYLLVLDGAGDVVDTINPPVARRLGVPANLMEEYATEKGVEHYTGLSSILMNVGRLSDGRLVLVHHDVTHRGDQFRATGYLSLISADRQRACVDARLDFSQDARPLSVIVGDRLVTFEQSTDGRDAASTVKSYRIDDSGCDWVATG